MAYAVEYEVPSTPQVYDRVKSEIGDAPAKGLITHVVVRAPRGLRHIGVWETKEDWERFRDDRVRPAVSHVLAQAGLPSPPPAPAEDELEVVDVVV